MAAEPSGSRRGGRPGWVRWTIRIVVLVLVVWIAVSGVVLFKTRQHANDGLDALERARGQIDGAGLLRGAATAELRKAKQAFADAHALADGPVLAPWRAIPLVGGNLDSVESLTAAAEQVATVGERAADEASKLLHDDPTTGPERLALLGKLAKITRHARGRLREVDLGGDFFLFGPLGDARERFQERFDQVRTGLENATAAAEGVEDLLRGPRSYLVLGANNAEMRAGSGMLLSVGVAGFEGGSFNLGDMRSTTDFPLPAGAVALPPELQQLWGFAPITQDWRWLGTSPRFDVTAPLAAEMWERATGQRVDGVLAVDPVTVQALLAAQGPVDVDGRHLSSADVLEYLLRGQYDLVDASDPEQVARRDQLSTVAKAAVDTLSTRAWNADGLVQDLSKAGQGRHVLAWSRDPAEQRAWEAAGIAGVLEPDSLAVSVLNTGGNKLDQFLQVKSRLGIRPNADGGSDATVDLHFTNTAPADLPPYVGGPYGGTDLVAGEYQGLVSVNTPGAGSLPKMTGLDSLLVLGRDGPTKTVAAGPLRLKPGEQATVIVRFALPDGFGSMLVASSARVPPISWVFRGVGWDDNAPYRVHW